MSYLIGFVDLFLESSECHFASCFLSGLPATNLKVGIHPKYFLVVTFSAAKDKKEEKDPWGSTASIVKDNLWSVGWTVVVWFIFKHFLFLHNSTHFTFSLTKFETRKLLLINHGRSAFDT